MSALLDRLQGALGDSYAIERELGGGGMSRVFVAHEVELGRKVVVKVLPPEMAAGVNADRFRREIQLAASLQHPHIVPLLRAGRADDLVWYTMPLVDGESLRAKLVREGELPIPEVVRILRDISSALAYAHVSGVVHRDIKPDNVLISHKYAVVTDFGVAKAVSEATGESSLTSLGIALGTPAYMAPEQASADPHADHRADIYALGVLGYEMLAGRPPFTAPSPQMVLAAQVTQAPQPITEHRRSVPPALAGVIMRCLEKKPADRWQTAAEVQQQFELMATPSGGMAPTAALPATVRTNGALWKPRSLRIAAAAVGVVALLGAAAFLIPRLRNSAAVDTAAAARPMLVVLPFQNLGSAEDQYFADGITEEITSRLAALGGLGVISRTSAMQYRDTNKPLRQIGEELNVGYVLEGTIRWEKRPDGSSTVRVSPQLIKVADDTHLWAQTYDADLTEVFRVQSDIAAQVAQALNVTLLASRAAETERPPTSNVEAYQHYLRGNEYFYRSNTERDVRAGIDLYERAVALDPRFAAAHARLSIAHSQMYWFYYDRTQQRLDLAREAVAAALRLDPHRAEGHVAQGYLHYWGSRDYARALAAFEEARRIEPSNPRLPEAIAYVLRRQGRWAEARQSLERAATLDPRAGRVLTELGNTTFYMRDFDQSGRWYERALSIVPDEVISVLGLSLVRALQSGRLETGHRIIAEAIGRTGATRFAESIVASGYGTRTTAVFGGPAYVQAVMELPPSDRSDKSSYHFAKADAFAFQRDDVRATVHFDSARISFERLIRQRPDDAFYRAQLALSYAGLGRMDDALREAERGAELLPLERDALDGQDLVEVVAEIRMRIGQHDQAVAILERLLSVPSSVSVQSLRLDPRWDPLRSHPRFRQLVARR